MRLELGAQVRHLSHQLDIPFLDSAGLEVQGSKSLDEVQKCWPTKTIERLSIFLFDIVVGSWTLLFEKMW